MATSNFNRIQIDRVYRGAPVLSCHFRSFKAQSITYFQSQHHCNQYWQYFLQVALKGCRISGCHPCNQTNSWQTAKLRGRWRVILLNQISVCFELSIQPSGRKICSDFTLPYIRKICSKKNIYYMPFQPLTVFRVLSHQALSSETHRTQVND